MPEEMNAIAQGIVEGFNTMKDGTVKIRIALLEQSPENMAKLFSMNNQHVKVYMTTENITQEATEHIDEWEIEAEGKSPSKRLRNVLYRLWEMDPQGYEDYEIFYRNRMEKIITQIKGKLE